MVQMVKVAHSCAIRINWWPEKTESGREINKEITECLDKTLTGTPPDLWLPVLWWPREDGIGGAPPEDPGTIYLTLPFEDLDGVTWSASLSAMVDDIIESLCLADGKVHGADGKSICLRLARHLKENAVKLELAMAKEDQLSEPDPS